MITVYCCELCEYLFACSRDGQRLCVECNDKCIIGKEEFKVKVVGICVNCLREKFCW